MLLQRFKKSRVIWEIDHNPKGYYPQYYCYTSFEEKLESIDFFQEARGTIQAQPAFPPTPFIFAIPAANSPPKDPERAAAEKKRDARRPSSLRLYQHDK